MDMKFKVDVPPFIRRLAATAKCKIYIVGGFIRNAALNLGNTDIDICGALLPEELGGGRRGDSYKQATRHGFDN